MQVFRLEDKVGGSVTVRWEALIKDGSVITSQFCAQDVKLAL